MGRELLSRSVREDEELAPAPWRLPSPLLPSCREGSFSETQLEVPRILGTSLVYTPILMRYQGVWWRHVCSASFLVEFFSEARVNGCALQANTPRSLLWGGGRLSPARWRGFSKLSSAAVATPRRASVWIFLRVLHC